MSLVDRTQLRRQIRRRRRELSRLQQRHAAQQLCKLLICQPLFLRSKHIAFYLPNDGEISPAQLLSRALRMGKKCYLPSLSKNRENYLQFVRYTNATPLQRNHFGIPEPIANSRNTIAAKALDLVLLPLVAFDSSGGRLGMGGGFYDRSFAFKRSYPAHKPYLLGLAHQCQEVPQLPVEKWDIPLNSVVTDRRIVVCK
ncbi:MAG: 5-formyltetrahydrofolate cyclo-ligase [Exilibacterium sp.]